MSRSAFFLPPQGHFVRPRLRLAGLALKAAWFGLALVLVSILIFRLGGITAPALFASLVVAGAILLWSLTVALTGLARAWFLAARGGSKAFGAAVVSIIGLVPFALVVALAAETPATDRAYSIGLVEETGAFAGDGAILDVADLSAAIPARRYAAPAVEVTEAVQTTLNQIGWQIEDIAAVDGDDGEDAENDPLGVIRDSGAIPLPSPRSSIDNTQTGDQLGLPARDLYVARASASDWLLGLPSDVTIQVEAEDERSTVVDIRSVSRVAPYDLGQNRRFIEAFYGALDLVMAGEEDVGG